MLYDILRTDSFLWDLYTRKEEYSATELDKYLRFCSYSCGHDPMVPDASRYLVEKGLRPSYPGKKKFAVALSHDIDFCITPP